ncbi:hypothetical protein DYJ33_29140, partial [Salmonella enterica]|nr:hypothetical protein [Salmonella enterica]
NAGLHMLTDVSTDRNIVLRGDARRHIIIQNEDGSVRAYIYKDKGGDGIRINNGVDGTGDFVFNKNGEFYSPAALRAGGAAVATDGNVYGSIWGGWLNDWLNNNLSRKNTASLATNGWFKDASTGLIIQWGITGGNLNKAVVNLPIPFPNAGLWSLGWVSGTLDMGNDDWSNSASLLNNSQLTVTTDHWWSTAWIAIGN